MGYKDTVTKDYMKRNEIFADAVNYYVFQGQQVVRPDQLRELDTTEIVVPYGADSAGEPEQRYRDVLKSLTAMMDDHAAYLILGIENQGEIHYAMPVKNLLYDAINYAKQVQKAANSHREAKDAQGKNRGEFLSGFYKEDRLLPVITLVILWSPEAWDGPMSLHEMFLVQDERILSLVPDYKIHLITPSGLSDQELDKFHTSLREVLSLIKYANDKEGMERTIQKNGHKLRIEEIHVLNRCINMKLELKDGEEEVELCKAWEDMKKEVAEETAKRVEAETTKRVEAEITKRVEAETTKRVEAATKDSTLLESLRNLMESLHMPADQAMEILRVPESKRTTFSAML